MRLRPNTRLCLNAKNWKTVTTMAIEKVDITWISSLPYDIVFMLEFKEHIEAMWAGYIRLISRCSLSPYLRFPIPEHLGIFPNPDYSSSFFVYRTQGECSAYIVHLYSILPFAAHLHSALLYIRPPTCAPLLTYVYSLPHLCLVPRLLVFAPPLTCTPRPLLFCRLLVFRRSLAVRCSL